MRTHKETDLEEEIELLRGQLLSSYARVDELEAALRGYVKATTGQESATVTFPMALERRAAMNGIHEHDINRLDKLMEKGALEQWAAIQIRNLAEQRIKDTAEIGELREALEVSKHETGTVDNALYKYEVLWSNCKGWREFDWPEGFCRRTADLIVENAERMLANTGRYPEGHNEVTHWMNVPEPPK